MLSAPLVIAVSCAYLLLLFGVASWGDRRALAGRSVIASPALAAVKEAVFQVTMAQLDPPLGSESFGSAARRLAGTARRRWVSP